MSYIVSKSQDYLESRTPQLRSNLINGLNAVDVASDKLCQVNDGSHILGIHMNA
jgi:hypothetical protein